MSSQQASATTETTETPEAIFDFGQNWQDYSTQFLDETRLQNAVESLKKILGRGDLCGLTFLDVGCGTGLFSIAASLLGAKKVVGVDVNPKCVAVSTQNAKRFTHPNSSLHFAVVSALDQTAMLSLGHFDIVYAWGSLHHSGHMVEAIRNTSHCVAAKGIFVVAIYNKDVTSPVWWWIKKIYNRLPSFLKVVANYFFVPVIYLAKLLVTRKNPLNKERGMSFYIDVVDWIGGYPYEYASCAEMEAMMSALDFHVVKTVPATTPIGCNEFVCVKNER